MKTNKGQSSQIVSIPSPIGGLNGRDAVAAMPSTDAPIMENWFPGDTSVSVRGGSFKRNDTVFANPILTLAVHNGNATNKAFAVSGSVIYEVTATGAPVASYAVGINSDIFQWCQMGTVGGRFLMMFDGVSSGKYYDGAVWSTTTLGAGATQISGVDPINIINCNIYKNRLYLVEKNSANVWYLPINSIYGAATKLDLSSLLRQGSTIMAMCTWTIDNAAGLQEYAVFISNTGEILTYQGSDPSVATDFKLASRFSIGRPVSYRCFEQVGSDVIVLCDDGAFPLSKALLTDRSQLDLAVSDKIRNVILSDIINWRNTSPTAPLPFNYERWGILLYPHGSKLIINVAPTGGSAGVAHQYVMNTSTGAWTKFTGWDAYCFVRFNDLLLFGGRASVWQADTNSTTDDTNGIAVDCQQAFQSFGTSGIKQFTAARPVLNTDLLANPPMRMDYNYGAQTTTSSNMSLALSASVGIKASWQSLAVSGFSGALRFKFSRIEVNKLEWESTDIMFKTGGSL